ncbi:hypothetical protein K501DRAFT_255842 [Backusella circina FSU 941]|nr:hypothetical protein K501DRAFT_255842 [Backusella circina FSU 941]
MTSENHSFHNCPLRSSSLMIINSEKQTIVTATDEVFTTLGYEPHQLIDKSIEILGLRQEKNHYMLQHESFGQMIPFDICVHHDPMSNAADLDYWLIRPITSMMKKVNKNEPMLPATILRLSTFGTVEQAYTCSEFPQDSDQLNGRPIMSFVHESDVRFLCEKLCKVRHRKRYYMFEIRWLCRGREEHDDDKYIWVEFTVINSPRRRSCSSAYEPQTRPICIIRPLKSNSGTTAASKGHTFLPNFMFMLAERSRMTEYFVELVSVLHMALDQGATYLVEFIAHLLTYTIDVCDEFMYYIRGMSQEEKPTKTSKKKCYPAVKVSLDDSIWLVPLTQKLEQWTRFNRDAGLCKPKKN